MTTGMMPTGTAPPGKMRWWGFAGLFGFFFGLCAIFALVVTLAEGVKEHAQTQWPETSARIQRCDVETRRGNRSETSRIECRVSYVIGPEEIVTKVGSRSIPSGRGVIWQSPGNGVGDMQEWVDQHPQGTPMAVHYDPANHKSAALVVTDMPLGGPRTPSNLRLLGIAAGASVFLLTIARVMQARCGAVARAS